jgi:hypothetical protein
MCLVVRERALGLSIILVGIDLSGEATWLGNAGMCWRPSIGYALCPACEQTTHVRKAKNN